MELCIERNQIEYLYALKKMKDRVVISVLIIALFGFDCLTSMTAVSATLTNSGPGLGQIVGPSGTYATIPALAKFVLMMGKQFLQKK